MQFVSMKMHTAIGNGPGEPPEWDTLAPRVQCRPAKQGQDRRKLFRGTVLLLEIGYYDETTILFNPNTVWLHCDPIITVTSISTASCWDIPHNPIADKVLTLHHC